ncbi:MAG TPA: hypothetical protein VJH95_01315 [Candidatus Nanoarchaeia archaeon]|nr:hypothetical protein [Candidatus Nanoarchaeia archaeon]
MSIRACLMGGLSEGERQLIYAEWLMDKYESIRDNYPERHPCYRALFLGEAGLCLQRAGEICGVKEQIVALFRERLDGLIEEALSFKTSDSS